MPGTGVLNRRARGTAFDKLKSMGPTEALRFINTTIRGKLPVEPLVGHLVDFRFFETFESLWGTVLGAAASGYQSIGASSSRLQVSEL